MGHACCADACPLRIALITHGRSCELVDLKNVLTVLARRKLALTVAIVVAVVLATLVTCQVSVSPLSVKQKRSQYGAASTQYYVDSQRSSLSSVSTDILALAARAQIVSQFMGSAQVQTALAKRLGVPPGAISVTAQASSPGSAVAQPTIPSPAGPHLSLTWQTQQSLPTVLIFTTGPDAASAARLADASIGSLQEYLGSLNATTSGERRDPARVVVRQSGRAVGYTVKDSSKVPLTVGVVVVVFLIECLLLLLYANRRSRRSLRDAGTAAPPVERLPDPA